MWGKNGKSPSDKLIFSLIMIFKDIYHTTDFMHFACGFTQFILKQKNILDKYTGFKLESVITKQNTYEC